MGRHSSQEHWPFYRSVIGWLIPWALIAGVVGVAVWVAVGVVGADTGDGGSVSTADRSTSPSPTPSPEASETIVVASPSPTPEPTKTEEAEVELITEGITVQVLNATGDDGADDAMADRLSDLGYEVIAVEPSSASYPRTTVFWSTSASKGAAQALASKFGWLSDEKPGNLSDTVSIHVVVGADEV